MSTRAGRVSAVLPAVHAAGAADGPGADGPALGDPARRAGLPDPADETPGHLFGIGAAAERAGVSQRALRYYQQIGLLTPCGCTPGGLRRYSQDDLARVARIRQLRELLGLNLDEVARVLRDEDRLVQIKRALRDGGTGRRERQRLLRESLDLQQSLRATVEAKRQAIEAFLADMDARIGKTRDVLGHLAQAAGPRP